LQVIDRIESGDPEDGDADGAPYLMQILIARIAALKLRALVCIPALQGTLRALF